MGTLIYEITLPKFEEWRSFGPSVVVTCKITEKETSKCFFCKKEGKIFTVLVSGINVKITRRPNLDDGKVVKQIIENIVVKYNKAVLSKNPCCAEHVFRLENDSRYFFEKRKGEIKKIKIDGI